jgi:hypothetical protein
MPNIGTAIKGLAGRLLPSPAPDNVEGEIRVGIYGDQSVESRVPTKHLLADEGSYFLATNPIIGTGVAHALVTAFAATSGLFVIKNNGPSNGKRIYLDYLRLMVTAIGTACVSEEFAFVLDSGNRAPTAGNVAVVPVNTNGDVPSAGTIAVLQAFSAGALTVPAAVTPRTVGRVKMPVGVNIVGDEYVIQFGSTDPGVGSGVLTAIRAVQPAKIVAHAAPIVIGGGQSLVIHRWGLTEATTAPSFEYELAWWER